MLTLRGRMEEATQVAARRQIENDEAGFYLLGFLDTLRTIRRVKQYQVFSFERIANRVPDDGVIVNGHD